MRRQVLGLALAAFVILGFGSWVALMPKPSTAPLQGMAPEIAQPATNTSATAATPAAGDTQATGVAPTPSAPANQQQAPAAPAAPAPQQAEVQIVTVPDDWAEQTAAATRLRVDAVRIYADVASAQKSLTPSCGVSWTQLAALASPEDVQSSAIDASSRGVARTLCSKGIDMAAPGGFEKVLGAMGRNAAQASMTSDRAAAYAAAASS